MSVGRIPGVVLAGGLGRRMGRDKAAVMLGGRSLLARTCGRLAPQCAGLAVSRHAGTADDAAPGLPVVQDGLSDRAGPLSGVLAALDWCADRDPAATHVATVAVDTPFLPLDLVERLVEARCAGSARIACAASAGRLHPVAALWPIDLREDLRRFVHEERGRRVLAILDRAGFVAVDWPTEPYDPFLNLNTPDDLARAAAVAEAVDAATASQ